MEKFKRKISNEKGEIMLESTFIMIMTLMVLIAMISVGFLFYQQAMLNTVATELATEIASNYKITEQEIGSTDVNVDTLKNIKLYRTSVSMTSMKVLHKQRAEEYLPERVKLSTLGFNEKDPKIENFNVEVDNVGRMHTEITISLECDILFGGALKYFGIIDSTPKFTATGRAECLDLTGYSGHVQFLNYVKSKMESDGGVINDILEKVVKVINNAESIADIFL